MSRMLLGFFASVALVGSVFAEEPDFEPLPPLDLSQVSPDMVEDVFGHWTISDVTGHKTCAVVLKRDPTIGGMEIDIDSGCARVFPVLADITAWRLLEGWAIDLADAERATRIRFTTPDDRYVAFPEVDGVFTIAPKGAD